MKEQHNISKRKGDYYKQHATSVTLDANINFSLLHNKDPNPTEDSCV